MSGRILVVEDDERIRSSMRLALEGEGYEVRDAASGEEGLDMFAEAPPDVALIDLMLPGMDGFECCRALRRSSAVPIIIVTARADTHDVVAGLEAGADDYVTKPFRLRELIARLRAVLRRTRALETTELPVIQAGSLTMDLHRRILWRSGTQVHLSPKEFDLLAFMMQNQGAPLTHVRLLRSVWGPEYGNELEYLRSYVRMLRKKIEADPAKPSHILTEPWVGYRFRNPSDQDSPGVASAQD
jgi:two-component system KDP operon response regulator KdpE